MCLVFATDLPQQLTKGCITSSLKLSRLTLKVRNRTSTSQIIYPPFLNDVWQVGQQICTKCWPQHSACRFLAENSTSNLMNKFNTSDRDVRDFYLSTAHQFQDLIDMWAHKQLQSSFTNNITHSMINRWEKTQFELVTFWTCRCLWQGTPCNMTEQFTTILTDFGMCYTFNDKHSSLQVSKPGLCFCLLCC